jgi:hypothetical protein
MQLRKHYSHTEKRKKKMLELCCHVKDEKKGVFRIWNYICSSVIP